MGKVEHKYCYQFDNDMYDNGLARKANIQTLTAKTETLRTDLYAVISWQLTAYILYVQTHRYCVRAKTFFNQKEMFRQC